LASRDYEHHGLLIGRVNCPSEWNAWTSLFLRISVLSFNKGYYGSRACY